jgi:hypothetical protein
MAAGGNTKFNRLTENIKLKADNLTASAADFFWFAAVKNSYRHIL